MVCHALKPAVVLAAIVLVAGSPLHRAAAQDDAIRAVAETYPGLLDDGDINRLLDLLADDVVFIHPRLPAVVGKDSMRLFLEQVFGQQSADGSSLRVEAIQISGTWAHVKAEFETVWTPRNGDAAHPEHARYLWVLRRDLNGAWKVKAFSFYPIA